MSNSRKRVAEWTLWGSMLATVMVAHPHGHDQHSEKSVQERLGFEPQSKLLVIHADDLGMSHPKNVATFAAMKEGVVTSASVMMPTPWMREAVEMAKANPELDIGVHLTLTAEWNHYKWGPLLGADTVPSLVTADGVFHATVPAFAEAADIAEVEAEVRAQIDLALKLGVDVTHLDGHMGSLLATDEIAAMYMRIGREYRLPIRLHKHFGDGIEGNARMRSVFLNYPANYDTDNYAVPEHFPDGMVDYYNGVLRDRLRLGDERRSQTAHRGERHHPHQQSPHPRQADPPRRVNSGPQGEGVFPVGTLLQPEGWRDCCLPLAGVSKSQAIRLSPDSDWTLRRGPDRASPSHYSGRVQRVW